MSGRRMAVARPRPDRGAVWAVVVALVAGGLSPVYAAATTAACLPAIPLSLFGVHVDLAVESSCVLGLADAGIATAHAGPLAWTLCLGLVWLALLTCGGLTGLGFSLRRLLSRARDWFTRHASLTRCPVLNIALSPRDLTGTFRLPDLRSAIVARPSPRRGPPAPQPR